MISRKAVVILVSSLLPAAAFEWDLESIAPQPPNFDPTAPVRFYDVELDSQGREVVGFIRNGATDDNVQLLTGNTWHMVLNNVRLTTADLVLTRNDQPRFFVYGTPEFTSNLQFVDPTTTAGPLTVTTGSSPLAHFAAIRMNDGNFAVIIGGTIPKMVLVDERGNLLSETPLPQVTGQSTDQLALCQSQDGLIHVAACFRFYDATSGIGNSSLRHLSYSPASSVASSWSTVTANATLGFDQVARRLAIATQSNGEPFIGFWDEIDEIVRGAVRSTGTWSITTIAVGRGDPIEAGLDAAGRPMLAWTDPGNAQTYFSNKSSSLWTGATTLPLSGTAGFAFKGGYLHGFGRSQQLSPAYQYDLIRDRNIGDTDKDGQPYLVEVALRGNPNNPTVRGEIDYSLANGKPAVVFQALAGTSKLSNSTLYSASNSLFYEIQVSDDLKNWVLSDSALDTDVFTINGRTIVTSVQNSNAGAVGSHPFMRVKLVPDL